MRKSAGAILLLASVILLGWGVDARDSLGSGRSTFPGSAPTNRTIWQVLAGAVCLSVGLGLLALPGTKPEE